MKQAMVLLMCLVFAGSKSQNDSIKSLKAIKFSGIQVDMNGITDFNGLSLDKQQAQKFANNDPLLNLDLSTYSVNAYHGRTTDYSGSFGFKIFGTLTKKRKYDVDVFCGLYFGGGANNNLSYNKVTYDTISTYTNSSGKSLYEINRNDDNYFFNVTSNQFMMPLGVTLTTNKKRRVWISAGISITPGIRTNYVFSSSNYVISNRYIVEPNFPQKDYYTLLPTENSSGVINFRSQRIKQTGYVGYVSAPVSVNLRLSKKVKFLKHLNATMSVAPAYYASYDKINKLNQSFALVSNFGFRYNL